MSGTGLEEQSAAFQVQTGVFGMHLTLDGYGGDSERLADPNVIRAWLDELPTALGMSKLIEPCLVEVAPRSEKDSGGVTGFVLIAESHLSVHTFPQRRFLIADVFTCQDQLDHDRVRRSLITAFGLEDVETHLIRRGTRYPLTDFGRAPAGTIGAALDHQAAAEHQLAEAPAAGYALDRVKGAVNGTKARLLERRVEHIDISRHDTQALITAFEGMSFSARDLARATDIYARMLSDPDCTIVLALAGSSSAAGCMRLYADLVDQGMVDVVVATGAAVVDMDLFEAFGFAHYQGNAAVDDRLLRQHRIDRIYDTYIDEAQLQACDLTVKEIADQLAPTIYSSRAFIREIGRWLVAHPERVRMRRSLVQTCFERKVPIFCPALSDSSAGLGLVAHQVGRPDAHVVIDSVRDFRELTEIKMAVDQTGLLIVGGGVPKNFVQDTVICAEILGRQVPMHKYSVQITVADPRDGGCSGSTLKEAGSWGKVDDTFEQMVYAEATLALPLLAGAQYHSEAWRPRPRRALARLFDPT